jgi:hypothetical protein
MVRTISVAVAASALTLFGLAPAKAQVYQYGYSSSVPLSGNSGKDYFNNNWLWSKTVGGSNPGPGKGYSVWGTPGLGKGDAVYKGALESNNFEITFEYPIPLQTKAAINQTVYSGAYTEGTRLAVDGQLWNAVYVNNNTVDFFAPKGEWITNGDDFFLNVVFNQKNLTGYNTGFTATWSSSVPEASTWAMMLAGFVGLGLVGWCRQKAVEA